MDKSRIRVCALLILGAASLLGQEQKSYMVWDAGCLTEVSKEQDTKLIAPMKDGQPDKSQMKVLHIHVAYVPSCGHVVVTRDNISTKREVVVDEVRKASLKADQQKQ